MASGRNSKVIRALAKELTTVTGNEAEMVELTKHEGTFTDGSVSTSREIVIGKDVEGNEITMTTRSLTHPKGSYRQVLKELKKEFRVGTLVIS